MATRIEWTEATWNPVAGCTPVSAGCEHCYAARQMARFPDRWPPADRPFSHVRTYPDRLEIPARRVKPTMYFVPSMGDLFHEDVPYAFQRDVFDVMNAHPRHIFQVLTKRPANARDFWYRWRDSTQDGMHRLWPRNVWMGVTVENQDTVDRLRPLGLLPAPVRFVSYEPALGPLELPAYTMQDLPCDWLIVGCETGPNARRPDDAWLDSIMHQCVTQRIPVFVKAWRIDGNVVKTPRIAGRPRMEYPLEAIANWRRDYPTAFKGR